MIAVGSKVNSKNADNQRIWEDSNFYSQSFGISGSQLPDSSSTVSPLANHAPLWSRDSAFNLGALTNNLQTVNRAPQTSTQLRSTLATSKSEQPGQEPTPDDQKASSFSLNVTSTKSPDRVVTLNPELKGMVIPRIWNPGQSRHENTPVGNINGLTQVPDVDGDWAKDLFRLELQDGGFYDGDRLANGRVKLEFDLAELKPTGVPSEGGHTQGTEGNNYLNAQASVGTNRLEGKGGMDVLIGSPQRDVLICGSGNDSTYGGAGVDQL